MVVLFTSKYNLLLMPIQENLSGLVASISSLY